MRASTGRAPHLLRVRAQLALRREGRRGLLPVRRRFIGRPLARDALPDRDVDLPPAFNLALERAVREASLLTPRARATVIDRPAAARPSTPRGANGRLHAVRGPEEALDREARRHALRPDSRRCVFRRRAALRTRCLRTT